MRYHALACDYDGTLAHHGGVDDATFAALQRVRDSGRRLVLVTGRRLDDLLRVCSRLDSFDRVVAENGALLYDPATRQERLLAEPPPIALLDELRARSVAPLDSGRVVVATWEPNDAQVLAAIRDLGLELQVVFNKGAVMVLPSGINKASGLRIALGEIGLSPHNAVGVGDAENDHAFLSICECAVTVANALPALKERSDWVTSGDHGAGVIELIERLVGDDLGSLTAELHRHDIVLGSRVRGEPVMLPPAGVNVLLAGPSGSGKSTLAGGLVERIAARGYQILIVDPEGDHDAFDAAVALGDAKRQPLHEEIVDLLAKPGQSAVVNLLGVPLADRPAYFEVLLRRLDEMRARSGRPHWIVIDEAHHLMPSSWDPRPVLLRALDGLLLITVHPEHLSPTAVSVIDTVIAVGRKAESTMAAVPHARAALSRSSQSLELAGGEAVAWSPRWSGGLVRFNVVPPEADRRRHQRKYAEGELGEDKSFYFRGADGRLRLRARNLSMFVQLAEGVDDETWLHHLRRKHYSEWFRGAIGDEGLAEEVAGIESQARPDAIETRKRIRAAIERRYSLPA
jgi:hydroxymethylpyrimidine pyrophosphatase-like HAD family hydrolase